MFEIREYRIDISALTSICGGDALVLDTFQDGVTVMGEPQLELLPDTDQVRVRVTLDDHQENEPISFSIVANSEKMADWGDKSSSGNAIRFSIQGAKSDEA